MQQVTGVVVGHARMQCARRRDDAGVREVFARIAYSRREALRAIAPRVVVLQQPAVALEVRPTAGRVDDERVDVEILEGGDVAARKLP